MRRTASSIILIASALRPAAVVAQAPATPAPTPTLTLSADVGKPLAGTAAPAVVYNLPPHTREAVYAIAIDGRTVAKSYVSNPAATPRAMPGTVPLDTATMADGPHLLDWIVVNMNPDGSRAVVDPGTVPFATANGATPRALSTGWAHLRMPPGGTQALAPFLRNCDGSRAAPPAPVAFATDTPGVATVDPAGLVAAVAPGVATIRATAGKLTASTTVVVDPPAVGFPHLSRSGQVLHEYTPGRSVFVRSAFNLGWDATRGTPGLAAAAHAAGINALDQGVYVPGAPAAQYAATLKTVADAGFLLVAGGDNWARGAADLAASLTPAGAASTAACLGALRDSGLVPMIEVVDEATYILGTPPPPGVAQLMQQFAATPGRPAAAWPIFSLDAPARAAAAWSPVEDYYSLNSFPPDWADSIRGFSVPTRVDTIAGRVAALLPAMDRSKPLAITNLGVSGGTNYPTGPGMQPMQPRMVTAQVGAALVAGACAIRAYNYDPAAGAAPTGSDDVVARWQALGAAYNLIGALEPDLLQPTASAVDAGPGFLTGARSGINSRVLIVQGDSDVAATADVDLSSYAANGYGRITAYRLYGPSVAVLAPTPTNGRDAPTVRPGETVVYVFQASGPSAPVPVPRPAADPRALGPIALPAGSYTITITPAAK